MIKSILTIVTIVATIFLMAAFGIPFLIKTFFQMIQYALEQPLNTLIFIGAFLFGCLVQAYGAKIDSFIDRR